MGLSLESGVKKKKKRMKRTMGVKQIPLADTLPGSGFG